MQVTLGQVPSKPDTGIKRAFQDNECNYIFFSSPFSLLKFLPFFPILFLLRLFVLSTPWTVKSDHLEKLTLFQ